MVGADQMTVNNANTNPWYVLMTLYGEQCDAGFKNAVVPDYDITLHNANRRLWNAWAGLFLLSSGSEQIDTQCKLTEGELAGKEVDLGEIRRLHRQEMMSRNGLTFQYPGFPEDKHQISLRNIELHHLICWDGFYFPLELNIYDSSFKKGACSSGSVFAQGAHFKNVRFMKTAHFGSSWFQRARFEDADFSDAAVFSKANFHGNVIFMDVRFGLANFRDAKLFSQHPNPDSSSGVVCFSDAVFKRPCDFANAKFGASALFGKVNFFDNAYFDRADFLSSIVFVRTNFHNRASFRAVHFLSDGSMKVAHHSSDISFSWVDFMAPTSFEDALFENV